MMMTTMTMLLLLLLVGPIPKGTNAFMAPTITGTIIGNNPVRAATLTTLTMTGTEEASPSTFREAEVLGLKLMQERKYEEALKAFRTGLKLPGSKKDVVRTKSLSGPSPVGGSMGGFESKNTSTLDEFELQAANYNMACAYAQLSQTDEAIRALEDAFENGFDNFATVRADPDLDPIKKTSDFERLMQKFEPKSKGFNPFGLFGKK